MEALSATVFALWMAFAPNPHDHYKPYRVPFEISFEIYRQASLYPDVEPHEAAAVMIAEHGGKAKPPRYPEPYPADSVGGAGETGLMQVSDWERRRFNWCHKYPDHEKHTKKCGVMTGVGLKVKAAELFGVRANIAVGVFNINRIKYIHPRASRCQKGSEVHIETPGEGARDFITIAVEPFHDWHAHYRCGIKARDLLVQCRKGRRCHRPVKIEGLRFTRACKTRWRASLVERLSTWKKLAFWYGSTQPDNLAASDDDDEIEAAD